jgi:hypothetical protein
VNACPEPELFAIALCQTDIKDRSFCFAAAIFAARFGAQGLSSSAFKLH